MAKTDLFYGDQGDSVKELQTLLNKQLHGSNSKLLLVDGIYGDETKKAVEAIQKQYGLTVDGIVGTDTWDVLTNGSLPTKVTTPNTTTNNTTNNNTTNKTNTSTTISAPTLAPAPTNPKYDTTRYGDTTEGKAALDAYEEALKNLNSHGKFEYGNQEQLDAIMQSILNREKFSYDLNGDALYQQYKDKAIQQGKMAMGDAIGQAQAMTGGYGNSYAQSVGQQMYQKELQNLNDIVPELYQMAYDRYNNEGQELYNQYGMLTDDYERGYGEHMDKYNQLMDMLGIKRSDYYDGADMFYTEQGNANNTAAQAFADAMAIWEANNTNAWNKASFEEEARRWEKEFGLSEKELNHKISEDTADRTESNAKDYNTSGGTVGYDNGSVSPENIKKMQEALGIEADGKWGSGSTKAAGGLTADEAWKAYQNGTLGKSGGNVQPKETKNTTDFISRFQTKSEYLARGHSLNEWNEYMESNIASFLRSGRINDEEAQYLIEYYGLE